MKLEEAIQHAKEQSENCENKECALEHKQLYEWLSELKSIKDNKEKTVPSNIYQFDPIIYPYKIWIGYGDPSAVKEIFTDMEEQKLDWFDTEHMKSSNATTIPVIKKDDRLVGAIIFFKNKKSFDYDIIAHEASHATKSMFEYLGIDVTQHEPFEYVIGWIANCCKRVKYGDTRR